MKSLKLCTSTPKKHCPIIFLPSLLQRAKFTTTLLDLTLIIPYIFLHSLRPVVKDQQISRNKNLELYPY